MKGPYILTALVLVASHAANAGSYLDTAIGGTDARIKVEDCGKKVCGTISIGGHKFVVRDSDIAAALKDSDIFSKFKDLKLFDNGEPESSAAKKEPKLAPPVANPPQITQIAPAAPFTASRPAVAPVSQNDEPILSVTPAERPAPAAVAPVFQKEVVEKKVAATNPAVVFDPTSPLGEWIVEDGAGRVQLRQCGPVLCGVVSAAKNPNDTDRHNPDAAKRSRPVIGMPVLLDMKPTKPNRWEGRIYNSEDGKTYTSNISLKNPDVLRVEGCAFGGLICGGQNWTRVKDAPQG